MIFGSFIFNNQSRSEAIADEMAEVSARYKHLHVGKLIEESGVTIRSLSHDSDGPRSQFVQTLTTDGGTACFWLLSNSIGCDGEKIKKKLSSHSWDRPPDIRHQWIAIQWHSDRGTLRIATDQLGVAWLYIARINGGFVFANDFGAVAAACPKPLTLDHETVLVELELGYSPDNRTIYNEITLAPPGALIELAPEGLKTLYQRPAIYGDNYHGWSDDKKFLELDGLFEKIVEDWFVPNQHELVLSLSAGYDSRYALALLNGQGITCPLLTFGSPKSDEVLSAQKIASRLGRTTSVFEITNPHWGTWQSCIEQLGNTGIVQWAGWAEDWMSLIRQHGNAVMIGYLGDALSGKHLGDTNTNVADWVDHWIKWSASNILDNPIVSKGIAKQAKSAIRDRFERLADDASVIYPFQTALHLDLFGRQRRWVATQPNLLAKYVTPITYFCDEDLMRFWSNLPLSDLAGQRLYLAYARNRFPDLFQTGDYNLNIGSRVRRKLIHTIKRATGQGSTGQGPLVIDHQNTIMQNRNKIIDLASEVATDFQPILDMDAFKYLVLSYGTNGHETQWKSQNIIKFTNMFILGRLGRSSASLL